MSSDISERELATHMIGLARDYRSNGIFDPDEWAMDHASFDKVLNEIADKMSETAGSEYRKMIAEIYSHASFVQIPLDEHPLLDPIRDRLDADDVEDVEDVDGYAEHELLFIPITGETAAVQAFITSQERRHEFITLLRKAGFSPEGTTLTLCPLALNVTDMTEMMPGQLHRFVETLAERVDLDSVNAVQMERLLGQAIADLRTQVEGSRPKPYNQVCLDSHCLVLYRTRVGFLYPSRRKGKLYGLDLDDDVLLSPGKSQARKYSDIIEYLGETYEMNIGHPTDRTTAMVGMAADTVRLSMAIQDTVLGIPPGELPATIHVVRSGEIVQVSRESRNLLNGPYEVDGVLAMSDSEAFLECVVQEGETVRLYDSQADYEAAMAIDRPQPHTLN